jgi:glycosyltransferase involved in cell wall biosynthesis
MNNLAPQVALSTIGKFHTFSLARQLEKRDMLACVYTTYPYVKLKNEMLPREKIKSRPELRLLQHFVGKIPLLKSALDSNIGWLNRKFLENYINRTISNCDVYVGLSGHCYKAGKKVKDSGLIYICDRGSSHIEVQDEIMRSEYERYGIPFAGIDKRHINIELSEYELADIITVPSSFAYNSFLKKGFTKEKLRLIPYGVDLTKFHPVGTKNVNEFNVVFVGNVSYQKGIPDLITAFKKLKHQNKKLHIVGEISEYIKPYLSDVKSDDIVLYGAVAQIKLKEIYSQSHVFCLPSLQEGLAMVMAEAMACGSPVIATENTGAINLFDDGIEGFILPIRSADKMAEKMQLLADSPVLVEMMSKAALKKVKSLGGWDSYGETYSNLIRELAK